MGDVSGKEEGEETVEVGCEPGQYLGRFTGGHLAVWKTGEILDDGVDCPPAGEVSVRPVSLGQARENLENP